MADSRNLIRLSMRDGDRLLSTLSARLDLSIYEDRHEVSTGLLNLVIPNQAGSNQKTIDFGNFGMSNVQTLVMYSTKEIDFQINASGDTYKITPPSELPVGQVIDEDLIQAGLLVLKTTGITSLVVTNNSNAEADLFYFAGGEKA